MNTQAPMCAFCEIVAREAPAREVFRNDQFMAFFPTKPATPGHTLLIPLSHIPDIWALDGILAGDMAVVTLHLAEAIRDATRPEGLNIIQSNGKAATQSVDHLHVHLVPRWENDDMGPIWPAKSAWPKKDLRDALTNIRDAVRGW